MFEHFFAFSHEYRARKKNIGMYAYYQKYIYVYLRVFVYNIISDKQVGVYTYLHVTQLHVNMYIHELTFTCKYVYT